MVWKVRTMITCYIIGRKIGVSYKRNFYVICVKHWIEWLIINYLNWPFDSLLCAGSIQQLSLRVYYVKGILLGTVNVSKKIKAFHSLVEDTWIHTHTYTLIYYQHI